MGRAGGVQWICPKIYGVVSTEMKRIQRVRSRWLMALAGVVTVMLIAAAPPMPSARAQFFGLSDGLRIWGRFGPSCNGLNERWRD